MNQRIRRVYEVLEYPCSHTGHQCRAERRSLRRVHRNHRRAVHVRLQLPPERALRTPTRGPNLLHGQPELPEDLHRVVHRVRDSLQHRADHMSSRMPAGDTEEGPHRVRVLVRRPLSCQIRQEDQPFRARLHLRRLRGQQIIRVDPRHPLHLDLQLTQRIAEPPQGVSGGQRHTHQIPSVGHAVAERMHPHLRIHLHVVAVRNHCAGGTHA